MAWVRSGKLWLLLFVTDIIFSTPCENSGIVLLLPDGWRVIILFIEECFKLLHVVYILESEHAIDKSNTFFKSVFLL